MPPTPKKIWKDKVKMQIKWSKFWSKHKFFCKNWTTIYLPIYLIINSRKNWSVSKLTKTLKKLRKSLTHEKNSRIWIFLTWNWQLILDWLEIKQENVIHIYDITITDVSGEIIRNYYTVVTCYRVTYVIS